MKDILLFFVGSNDEGKIVKSLWELSNKAHSV